jgi:hypothetical protein
MAKEYVPIFFDWLETTQDLSAEEKGNLIDAVVSYASGGEYEHLLSGGCRIAFRFLKGQVDRNAAISDVRRNARLNKTEQTITNDNKTEQTESNSPKENNKENNKDNKKEKEKQKKFEPPTVEEVAEYCKERGNNVNPQKFVDFYTAKGWKIGKESMKDWKASVRTWENRDGGKKVIAQNFPQRDYSDVNEQIMSDLADEMDAFIRGAG